MPKHTLICTIGTSLFYPNLDQLSDAEPDPTLAALAHAYGTKDWQQVAELLHTLNPTERRCGAEINSVADLLNGDYDVDKGNLHLLFSDTEDGKNIAAVLEAYFTLDDWNVKTHRVDGLKDEDPRAFRTRGLRNLAKLLGERVRETGMDFCAINATGGYKAQIAIAVLMGQALEIPVYYKHERFNAIIPFPPMPIALDFELWERSSGMFSVLSQPDACEPWGQFSEDWDERFETLVNRVKIDGTAYLELSAAGQIFHDTFRLRFNKNKTARLPPDSREKKPPSMGDHSHQQAYAPIKNYLEKIIKRSYTRTCHLFYFNPDLAESNRFRMADGKVQGIYSNRTWCARFTVITTAEAENESQLRAVVADLNEWLEEV